jgi:hypothetical protein
MSDRRAAIEKMKAKQAAKAPSARSRGGGGTSAASQSSAKCELTVLSPMRRVGRDSLFDARIDSIITDMVSDGRMLMPRHDVGKSVFTIGPLTDEKGGYLCEHTNFKKTDQRKPMQLAEYGYTTVKLLQAPNGPVDWATHQALFPGSKVTMCGVAVTSPFKQGVQVIGTYVPAAETAPPTGALDLEAPKLAFDTVADDKTLATRNAMLSLDTGGFEASWKVTEATDKTKQFVSTALSNERTTLLKGDGQWVKDMYDAAASGDGVWKQSLESAVDHLIRGAPFHTSGLGCGFTWATQGPTLMVPIYGVGIEGKLEDGVPGEGSKAWITGYDQPFFDCVLGDPGDVPFKGSSFKTDSRPSGGPWLWMIISAFAKGEELGDSDPVHLLSPVRMLVSVATMPVHFGSKCLETLKQLMLSFLPLVNVVATLETDRNNVASNPKADETWDCRLSTVDFYSALVKYGIALDLEVALAAFDDKPVNTEPADVAATFKSAPKQFLECGFLLLNESVEGRSKDWLEEKATQMDEILKFADRHDKASIEIRTINPAGFEAHKASLLDLQGKDPVARCEACGFAEDDWPVYAVLKIEDNGRPAKKTKK